LVSKIRKRDGRLEDFNPSKIATAISKAFAAVGEPDDETARRLADKVVKEVEVRFKESIPGVEDVQDIVEETLIKEGFAKVAKAYILYRQKRAEVRGLKSIYGVKDDLKLSVNAIRVLERRYLLKDQQGRVIETPSQMFWRVARAIAAVDELYGASRDEVARSEVEFYRMMASLEFLPNSPTLMNAGTDIGQLSACFVLPVEDSIEGIFDALKLMAIVHKSGGGCVSRDAFIYTTLCGVMPIGEFVEQFIPNELKHLDGTISIDVSSLGLKALAYNPLSGETSFSKILRVWRFVVPAERAIRLRLDRGFEVVTSEWHPFLVVEDGKVVLKRGDEVKPGFLILLPSAPIEWPFYEQPIVDGIKVTPELAWALGYILGDGSVDRRGVKVFDRDVERLRRLKAVLERSFGLNALGCIYSEKRYSAWIFQTLNKKVVGFIRKLLKPNGAWRVPPIMFKAPLNVVLSFIAGVIEAEGYIRKDRARLELSMVNRRVVEQLALLLSALGAKFEVKGKRPRRPRERKLYRLLIVDIPFIDGVVGDKLNLFMKLRSATASNRKVNLSFNHIKPLLEKIGVNVASLHRRPLELGGLRLWIHRWMWGHGISEDKFKCLMDVLIKELEERGLKDDAMEARKLSYIALNTARVKSIARLRRKKDLKMYDLTVEGSETYAAGRWGFLFIHNTGFSFSRLRPKGDVVASTKGVASGPVSFMRIFDVATEVIKQGGKRRGANMGVLRVDHPDIIEFINAKSTPGAFANFNLSVAVTDEFMEAVKENRDYALINPRTGEVVRRLPARDVFDLIVANAWRTGDPGLLFIDEINRHNPTPKLGAIEATNPCGEVPLLPYESCNLGSINLSRMVRKGDVDWDKLGETVDKAVHFLDNVIDANRYPAPEIEHMTKLNRKVGLGVMGFAELLIQLGVRYDSKEALKVAEEVMSFISRRARDKSVELGRSRGSFPSFEESVWSSKYDALRNATVTSIAPTGTISIIANTTSSIEPIFAIAYVRQVMEGVRLIEVNPLFERIARERGFYSESLMLRVAKSGTVRDVEEVPSDVRELFVTSLEVEPEWHVRVQAAFQKHVDNAVAKTINLRPDAPMEEVRKAFMLAYELKCKGITVYRYGSKPTQVLYIGVGLGAEEEPSPGCPSNVCPL